MKTLDLTQGSIIRGIVLFALPLLGTSVVQQLYSTVDILFVGNVLGTSYTAALGVGSLLITLLVGLFTGISVGVNVKAATIFGAGDTAALRRAIATTLALAFGAGAVLAGVGFACAAPFVDVMKVPPESAADSLVYLRFAVAAALPIGVYNICSGALRAVGDSRSPLVAQALGGLLNIFANWLALCVFGWGIAGCAFATFVSNGFAAAYVVVVLARSSVFSDAQTSSGGSARLDGSFARSVVLFGAPVALQMVAITLSNVFIQYEIDLLGVNSIAAFVIYLKVELPIYFVILALGQATTTFVAQNHGAHLRERCEQGVRVCQVLCLVLTVAMSVLMLAIGYWAFWIFDQHEAVIAIGLTMIGITFPFYFCYAVLEVQADTMRGYGHSLGPALVSLANICVLRVVLVLVLTGQGLGIEAIAATYPITWATAAICMVILRAWLSSRGPAHPATRLP